MTILGNAFSTKQRMTLVSEGHKPNEEKCGTILYSDVCRIFEAVEKERGMKLTAKKLNLLFPTWIKEELLGHSCFPYLRLILPVSPPYFFSKLTYPTDSVRSYPLKAIR